MTFPLCHEPVDGSSSTTLGGGTKNAWYELLSRKPLGRLMCGRPAAFRVLISSFLTMEAQPRHCVSEWEAPAGKAKPFRTSGGEAAEELSYEIDESS